MTFDRPLKVGRRDRLVSVCFLGIAFRGSEALLLMTPGHLFIGLSLALDFPLPLGEFFLTLSGHVPSCHESVRKKPSSLFYGLWVMRPKPKQKNYENL